MKKKKNVRGLLQPYPRGARPWRGVKTLGRRVEKPAPKSPRVFHWQHWRTTTVSQHDTSVSAPAPPCAVGRRSGSLIHLSRVLQSACRRRSRFDTPTARTRVRRRSADVFVFFFRFFVFRQTQNSVGRVLGGGVPPGKSVTVMNGGRSLPTDRSSREEITRRWKQYVFIIVLETHRITVGSASGRFTTFHVFMTNARHFDIKIISSLSSYRFEWNKITKRYSYNNNNLKVVKIITRLVT